MKQEIVCEKCRPKLRALFPTDTPYPEEHVKFIDGKAKHDFFCDQYGQSVGVGSYCTAFSSWADYGGVPYYNWEAEYLFDFEINIMKNKKAV